MEDDSRSSNDSIEGNINVKLKTTANDFFISSKSFRVGSASYEYNKSTANGTKYARQIFKEAMILTFD
jgi:hypothetical protein